MKSRKSENILLQERLVDLQEVQMKALEEAQKKATGLHENHAGRATPNVCSRTRETQVVFAAARKFICTKINRLT